MGDSRMPTTATPGARTETHELPFSRETNRQARRLLADFVGRQKLGAETAMDAAIVLGELVANGLDHGRPDPHVGLEVSWMLENHSLRLSVLDGGGRTQPHVVAAEATDTRGRGLAMVEALSSSWWVERQGGTRVTAVLPVH